MTRNRVTAVVAGLSFSALGVLMAVAGVDAGARALGVVLVASFGFIAVRGATGYSVMVSDDAVRIRSQFRTTQFDLDEIRRVRPVECIVVGRRRGVLAIEVADRVRQFPDINQRWGEGGVVSAIGAEVERRRARLDGAGSPG